MTCIKKVDTENAPLDNKKTKGEVYEIWQRNERPGSSPDIK
jgi:hypothetical protein